MKQILCRILVLLVVIAAILGLSSCNIFIEPELTTYDLVVEDFDREVVFGSELDLEGLYLRATTGDDVKVIPVNASMIKNGDTSSVGEKELTIEYGGFSWQLSYDVYYKVEHIVDGMVYDSQMVMSRDELFYVKEPSKTGSIFLSWDKAIPSELTDNLTITAVFLDGLELPKFSATYGDTLGDLELPEAKGGHWEWKHDLDTPVGNAGKLNTFTLAFIPEVNTENAIEFDVNISVAKKELEIRVLEDTFEYDGEKHNVKYAIYDGDKLVDYFVNVIEFSSPQSVIGTYDYTIQMADANYTATARKGSFSIVKIAVTVRVELDKSSIKYGEDFPGYRIIVEKDGEAFDFEDGIKLGIIKPATLEKGYYDIVATVKDENGDDIDNLYKYDITYVNAGFTVEGIDFNPGKPQFSTADGTDIFYGDKLSKVVFDPHPNGEWTWDFDYAGGDTVGDANPEPKLFRAIFTPYDTSYNVYYADIAIEVRKKELNVDLDMNNPAEKTVTVIYDGKEHGIKYVIWDWDANHEEKIDLTDKFSVTGNVTYVTAKEEGYKIVIRIDHPNYTGEDEFKLIIKKAVPETDFDRIITATWQSGMTLASIELPQGYAWEPVGNTAPNKVAVTGAGTYTYTATFTPEDTTNYLTVTDDFTVVVTHANSTIDGLNASYDSWTFNNNDHKLADLLSGITVTGTDRVVKYYYNGREVTTLKEAGTYLITVRVLESGQYKEVSADTIVIIKRATAEINNYGIPDNGWTYGHDAKTPYAYKNLSYVGDIVVEYKLASAADSAYTTTVPTLAGAYVARFSIVGGEGYNWNSAEPKYVNFTIAKAVVTAPTITSKIYTGSSQKADVEPTDLYTIKENLGGTNAGNYNVVLALTDSANYKWEKTDAAEYTATFSIGKAPNAIAPFEAGTWVYGDEISHSTTATFGEVVKITYYDKQNNKVTSFDAGEYVARAEVEGTSNYEGAVLSVNFTVGQLPVAVPELKENTFIYTGSLIKPEFKTAIPENAPYWVTNDGKVAVNNSTTPTYAVTLQLKNNNYKWADGDTSNIKSLTYVINKAEAKISGLTITGWTFGDDANSPSASTTFGTISYDYYVNGAWQTAAPKNAGNYTVRATVNGTGNFDGDFATFDFTIAKADATINGVNADKKYTTVYSGSKFSIAGVTSSHTETTPVYTIKNSAGVTVGEMVNADTYTVIISLASTANYNAAESIEVEVFIDKFDVHTPELVSNSRMYNKGIYKPAVKTDAHNKYYTYEYSTPDSTIVGTYSVNFTLNNENYRWDDATFANVLTYNITKANAEITLTSNAFEKYYRIQGYTRADVITGVGRSHEESELSYSIESFGDANTYTVIVSLPASHNYNAAENKTITVTIKKQLVYAPSISDLIYNGAAQAPDVDDSDLYEVFENVGGTNAAAYNVVLRLKNSANYKWSDDATDEAEKTTVVYNIKPATITLSELTTKTFKYLDTISFTSQKSYNVDNKTDFGVVRYIYSKTADFAVTVTPDDVGFYYVKAYVDGDINWGYEETLPVRFQITERPFDVPALSWTSKVYNDEILKPTVAKDDNIYSVQFVTENSEDVGTYTVKFTLTNSNYKWNDAYSGTERSRTYSITPATPTIAGFASTSKPYDTHAMNLSTTASIPGSTLSATITYYSAKDDAAVIPAPTNFGTYYVKASVGSGKNWSAASTDFIEINITKASANITVDTSDIVVTYGDTFALPIATTNLGSVNVDKTVADLVNVGTYYVTYTVVGNTNYNGDTETVKVIIGELAVDEPTVIGTLTYLTNASGVAIEQQVNLGVLPSYMTIKEGTNKGTLAGGYTVEITLDKNHKWAENSDGRVEWSIAKAKLTKPTANTATFTYNTESQTYTPVNFDAKTMSITNNVQSNANETGYSVVVSISDTANYEWVGGTQENIGFTFVINKLEVVEPQAIGTLTYMVDSENVAIAQQVNLGVLPSYMTVVEGTDVKSAAGNYTAKITLDENHKWASGSDGDVEWSIAKAKLTKPTANTTTFTYNTESQTYTPVNFDAKTMSITNNVQSNANETGYSVVVSISDTANYEWVGGTQENIGFTFRIYKLAVEEPTVSSTHTYTSVEHTVTLDKFYDSYMDIVLGTDKGTAAGNYCVEIKLDDNYVWKFGHDGKVDWTIAQATTSITGLSITGWTYDQYNAVTNKANYTVTTDSGFVIPESYIKVWYKSTKAGSTWSEIVPTDADTYQFKVVVGTDANENWAAEELISNEFTVEQLAVNEPTATGTYTYTVVDNEAIVHEVTLVGYDSSYMTITLGTNKESTAGTHTVIITLDNNHKWAENSDGHVEWSIAKAKIDLKDVEWNYSDAFAYNGEAKSVALKTASLPGGFGTIYTVNYTNNSETDEGDYTASAAFAFLGNNSSNYEFVGTVADCEWKIDPAEDNVVTFTAGATSWTYGDTVSYTATSTYGTPTIKIYDSEGTLLATSTGANGTATVSIKLNADTNYKVTVTYETSANWNTVENVEATFGVAQSTAYTAKANSIDDAVYGDLLLAKRAIPTGTVTVNGTTLAGTWKWQNVTSETKVGSAGTNTFYATFTPDDANYAATTNIAVTVNVAKYGLAVPNGIQVEYNDGHTVYSGVASSYFNDKLSSDGILDTDIIDVVDNGGSAVGDVVTLTLTIKDEFKGNYYWISYNADETVATTTYIVVVDKNSWEVDGEPTDMEWTYGEDGEVVDEPTANPVSGIGSEKKITYKLQSDADIPENWNDWSTISAETPAGTYDVKFVVTHPNYADMEKTVKLVIKTRVVELPTLATNSFTYQGKDAQGNDIVITPVVTHNDDETLYETINTGNVNVGTGYKITFTLPNKNYEWADGHGNEDNKLVYELTYNITAATDNEGTFTAGATSWTYGDTVTYTATSKYGTPTIKLYDSEGTLLETFTGANGTATVSIGLGAGTGYKVKVTYETSANWNAVADKETTFDVAQSTAYTATADSINAVYGDLLLSKKEIPTGSASIAGTWSWNSANAETTVGDFGTNKFYATFTPDDANYAATTNIAVTVNVAKADIVKPNITVNATYGDTLADIKSQLSNYDNANGNWTWVDADTTSVGDHGRNTFKAKFTSTDSNFNSIDEYPVTVVVAKKDISGATITLTGPALTYTGAAQTQNYTVELDGFATFTYDDDNTNVATNAGTHTITIAGTGNFDGEVTKIFEIKEKTITADDITVSEIIYNGEEQTPSVTVEIDGIIGSITYDVTWSDATVKDVRPEGRLYSVTVTGTDNFDGVVTKEFNVTPLDITENENVEISLDNSLTYNNGTTLIQQFTVRVKVVTTEGEKVLIVPCNVLEKTNEVKIAGSHTLRVEANDDNFTGTAITTFSVAKDNYDMSNVQWSASTFEYNQTEREVTIVSGLPTGVTVTGYEKNKGTVKGDYTATAILSYDEQNYHAPSATHNWSITTAYIEMPTKGTTSFTYDGTEKTFFSQTSTYWTATGTLKATDASTRKYVVTITFNAADIGSCQWKNAETGKETAALTYEYTISPLDITNATVNLDTSTPLVYGGNMTQNVISITKDGKTFLVKDGEVVNFLISGNVAETAGIHPLTVTANNSNFTGFVTCDFNVAKDTFDMTGVHWNYSGTPFVYAKNTTHTVELVGLPVGLTPVYSGVYSASEFGTYTAKVTFTYDTVNYEKPTVADCEWKINPAEDNVGTFTPGTTSWTYGDTVTYTATSTYGTPTIKLYDSEGTLLETFTGTNGTATVSIGLGAGTGYKVKVTYETSANWNAVADKETTFDVAPSTVYTATADAITDAVYRDLLLSKKEIPTGSASIAGTWSWTSANAETTVGDFGTNTFYATFEPTDPNYAVKTNVPVTVIVDKATFNMDGVKWDYSGTPFVYAKNTTYTVKLVGLPEGLTPKYGGVCSASAATDDHYTATVSFEYDASNYYAPGEIDDLEWKIDRAPVNRPAKDTTVYTYDGVTTHEYKIVKNDEFYKIEGTLSAMAGGTYEITITLADGNNTKWDDGSTASLVYDFVVGKGTNAFTGTLTMEGWEHDSTATTPSGITGAKWDYDASKVKYEYRDLDGEWYAESEFRPENDSPFGTYAVRAYMEGNNNYDKFYSDEVEFEITVKTVTIPEINATQEYVEDGDNYPTIKGTNDIFAEGDHGDYTVEYVEGIGTKVGTTYYVYVTLKDTVNTKWSDGTTEPKTLSYRLTGTPANIVVDDGNDKIVDGWTFGEEPADYAAVIKALTKVYFKGEEVQDFAMSLKYYTSNDANAVGSTDVPQDHGTYYFKIVVAAGAGYDTTESDFYQFEIAQAPLTLGADVTGITIGGVEYGTALESVSVSNKVYYYDGEEYKEISGTWSWDSDSEELGAVGNYTRTAIFTPSDDNYAPLTVEDVQITVVPKTITVTNSSPAEDKDTDDYLDLEFKESGYVEANFTTVTFKWNNEEVTLVKGESGDYIVTVTYAGGTATQYTNAGVYTVIVTLIQNADGSYNYNFGVKNVEGTPTPIVTQTFVFEIEKATLTLTNGLPENADCTYGGTYHDKGASYFEGLATLTHGTKTFTPSVTIAYSTDGSTYGDESTTLTIGDVGYYKITYTYTGNGNYAYFSGEVKIQITPAEVRVETPKHKGSFYEDTFNFLDDKNDQPKAYDAVTGVELVGGTFSCVSLHFNSENPNNSYYMLSYNPNNANYKCSTNFEVPVSLITVATLQRGTELTKYGSIAKALAAATTSGDKVWVIPDTSGNIVIDTTDVSKTVTVNAGTTLILPYAKYNGGNDANGTYRNNSYVATLTGDGLPKDTNLKTLVILGNGVTLEVKGTLHIAGELSGGNGGAHYSSHTKGNYGELRLGTDSTLIIPKDVNGKIECYGFITPLGENNGSKVEIRGGTLYQPFTLLDHQGGTALSSIKNKMNSNHIAPFYEYQFRNVQTDVSIHYGGKLTVYANMDATLPLVNTLQHNGTLVCMVGHEKDTETDKMPMLQLTSSESYLNAKFDKTTGILDLDLFGGAKLNSMVMTITFGTDIPLSTESVFFPLSWTMDISLNPTEEQKSQNRIAQYNAPYMMQLAWGGKFTVEKGAKFTVKDLVIHDNYETNHNIGLQEYAKASPDKVTSRQDAMFILRGELFVTDAIGGKVRADTPGAKIIAASVSCVWYKVTSNKAATEALTYNLSLWKHSKSDETITYTQSDVSAAAGVIAWYNGNDWVSGSTDTGFDVVIKYVGINSDGTETEIKSDYHHTYDISTLSTIFANTFIDLSDADDGNYKFIGWYLCKGNNGFTDEYRIITDRISLEELYTKLAADGYNNVTIYCVMANPSYTFEYDDGTDSTADDSTAKYSATQLPYASLVTLDQYDFDTTVSKYHTGWKLVDANGNEIATFTRTDVITWSVPDLEDIVTAYLSSIECVDNNYTFKLVAVWTDKTAVTVNYGENVIDLENTVIYLNHAFGQSSYDDLADLTMGDTEYDKSLYSNGWETPDGVTVSGTTVTITSTANVEIKAKWLNKVVLTIYYGENSLGLSPVTTIYLNTSQNQTSYKTSVLAAKTDSTKETFFNGWKEMSNCTVNAAGDIINVTSGATEASILANTWGVKDCVTVEYGNNNLGLPLSKIIYINPDTNSCVIDNVNANDANVTVIKYFDTWVGFALNADGTYTYTTDTGITITINGRNITLGGSLTDTVDNVIITAKWGEKENIKFSGNNGLTGESNVSVDVEGYVRTNTNDNFVADIQKMLADKIKDQANIKDSDPDVNQYFYGLSYNGKTYSEYDSDNPYSNMEYVEKVNSITVEWTGKYEVKVSSSNANVTVNGNSVSNNGSVYFKPGDKVTVSVSYTQTEKQTTTITGADKTTYTSPFDMPSQAVTISASSSSCIAAGTLITLADGTQKKVEDLLDTDILLVYDHERGEYVASPIVFIERDGWNYYNVIYLEYSNGVTNKLIYEHAMFDLTLNTYVYITEANYLDYVGHEFAYFNGESIESVTLENAYVKNEYTGCFSLVTAVHLNYFIDGMFSIPGGIEGIFNIFEYGEDLKYDSEQMQKDIETYGLYTYEDFAEYVPEEVFYAFQAQYFKVAVGKGMITFEEIIEMIDRYLVKNGVIE